MRSSVRMALVGAVLLLFAAVPVGCDRLFDVPQCGDSSDYSAADALGVEGDGAVKGLDGVVFCDGCGTFNTALWSKAEWKLGRGYVRAANVGASGGYYNLKLKANTWDGAEIYTCNRLSYGILSARFKAAPCPGAYSTLYFYQGVGSTSDEIDIEVYRGAAGWTIDFVVWKGGVRKYVRTYRPSFDPSVGFHEYRIDWTSTGVGFYIDRQLIYGFSGTARPTNSMRAHLNCWWPVDTALVPIQVRPTSDKYMVIDWISYTGY